MQELIKITQHENRQVVSARDLHAFLESKKQFADWIKHRIKKYGLIEGEDYQAFSLTGETGGRINEYALTLDAAKELSMVEGNEKGKAARVYFIEKEKELRALQAPSKTLTQAEILLQNCQLLVQQEQRLFIVENKINSIEAKITTSPTDYFAVAGYAKLNKIKVDSGTANKLGRWAASICKDLGYVIGKIPDAKYGSVNTYPAEVLVMVFDEHFKKAA